MSDEKDIEQEKVDSVLGVSDEDFLNMEEPSFDEEDSSEEITNEDTKDEPDEENQEDGESEEDEASDTDETDQDTDSSSEEADDNEDEAEDEEGEDLDESDLDEKDEEDKEEKSSKKKDKKESKEDAQDTDDSGIDYKAEYEKLMSEFSANGTKMKVKSVEDAITLMQMGANYHKKMSALKPSLKTLKLLENNGLLKEDKINFLIDLHNKDKDAITKLLKDSDIDPMDVDVKADINYKPTSRSVSDTEVELDSVLEGIQDSPNYAKTINVITKEWDETSRGILANNPQIISTINEHMELGIYDKVASAVAYQRSLGNLRGVSDIAAYKQMGDELNEAGEFGGPQPSEKDIKTVKRKIQKSSQDESVRKKRKKAVSSTKKSSSNANSKPFDPLSVSDEDFEKFDEKNLPTL